MARVPRSPSNRSSYDRDRRETAAEVERIDRKRSDPPRPIPLVKVQPEEVTTWPPGTAWLDTSAAAP